MHRVLIRLNEDNKISTGKYKANFETFIHDKSVWLVKNITMAQLLYNITAANNQIRFAEGVTEFTATITPGVYDDSDILTAIKTALEAAGAYTYNVTLQANTNRIQIAESTTVQNFSILATSNLHTAKWLGFVQDKLSAILWLADNPLNLLYPLSLQLLVEECTTEIRDDEDRFSTVYFPIKQGYGSIELVNASNTIDQKIRFTKNAKSLTVTIVDGDFQVVDLNGGSCEILIESC